MKRLLTLLMALMLLLTFGLFALGSGDSGENAGEDQGTDQTASTSKEEDKTNLGDYNVEIKSSRLTEDYEGKKVIVVTYGFTNHSEDATSFMVAVTDEAFQNGIGLNETLFVKDGDPYSSDNQMKDIKTGATIDVEVAYTLNDDTTPVEIEVSELISFDDAKITKTFEIA